MKRLGLVIIAACAVVPVVFGSAACSGPSGDPSATPSPTAAGPWRPGEFAANVDLCGATSEETLRELGLPSTADKASYPYGCRVASFSRDADLELTITAYRYSKAPARPDKTATDEAEHAFDRPNRWDFPHSTPLRGLGDEAKAGRSLEPLELERRAGVAVRVRNVVVLVVMEAASPLELGWQRVRSLRTLESGTRKVAREILPRLHRRPGTVTPVPAADSLPDVCAAMPSADRLAPGTRPKDTSVGPDARGCTWSRANPDGKTEDSLNVRLETVHDAEKLTGEWRPPRRWHRLDGVGDQAMVRRFESDSLRTVDLIARRGDRIAVLSLHRWIRGPGKRTPQMEKDLARAADRLLAAAS